MYNVTEEQQYELDAAAILLSAIRKIHYDLELQYGATLLEQRIIKLASAGDVVSYDLKDHIMLEVNKFITDLKKEPTDIELVRKRIINFFPYIIAAIKNAQNKIPNTKVQLAVAIKKPDGSGEISAFFEFEEFLNDIAKILGYKDTENIMKSLGL